MGRFGRIVLWLAIRLYFVLVVVLIVLVGILVFTLCNDVQAAEVAEVRAIIGEASGEGYQGMLAVACGIRNRGTLRGVYGLKAKHVDNEPEWVWKLARKAWSESKNIDIVNGGDHWESIDFKIPSWAPGMEITAKVGKHIFYKK